VPNDNFETKSSTNAICSTRIVPMSVKYSILRDKIRCSYESVRE
jgi:hypothetical protein